MIGNRIRLIRLANCMSLQQLTDEINKFGASITKTALFNYEAGKTLPNDLVMEALAHSLGVQRSFFFRPDWEDFALQLHGELGSVPARRQEICAYIQVELEHFLAAAAQAGAVPQAACHERIPVSAKDPLSIERAAETLRDQMKLGRYQLASVCSLLESDGWFLSTTPGSFSWSCISGHELSSGQKFLFFSQEPYLDDLRTKLLKEFGKAVLSYSKEEEDAVLRHFARAFLVPRNCVMDEFGGKRESVNSEELRYVKQKYGIARHDILRRLRDCDLISDAYHNEFVLRMQRSNHLHRAPSHHLSLNFFEMPCKLQLLVSRCGAPQELPLLTQRVD